MAETIVHRLYEEFTALTVALGKAVEPSLCVTANDCFSKALLLAAASHFEAEVTRIILAFVEARSNADTMTREFVRQKGLARQYHTLFAWDASNANRFFSLFGDHFKKYAEVTVKNDPQLDDAIRAFLELGEQRNRLVHQDFGNFSLEKTADEIFLRFIAAEVFINRLAALLEECPKPPDQLAVDEHAA